MSAAVLTALTSLGIEHDVKEYPTAGHAFLNDAAVGPRLLRPLFRVAGIGPDPQASADPWPRIEAFLNNICSNVNGADGHVRLPELVGESFSDAGGSGHGRDGFCHPARSAPPRTGPALPISHPSADLAQRMDGWSLAR